ncbi:MAG: menaquinone biosynthesis decarboxylase [Planctomycetaceae bacterium]
MQFNDLADFLATLEDLGELVRVSVEVDPVMEIAELTDRICKTSNGGPAILLENVRGSTFPAVVNLLGNERRIALALRSNSLSETIEKIDRLLHPDLPENWLGSLKLIPQLAQLTKLPPKTVKTAPSQQVVKVGRDVDLRELPLLQNRPLERQPVLTGGQVFTTHPETGIRDVSTAIFSMRDQNSFHIHWNPQENGWKNYVAYRDEGRQMPIAIALGGDPVLSLMASAPLPYETDGCLLAGFFRGTNLELIKGRSVPLEVPASADVVIEGLIDVEAEPVRGEPVALPTGFYSEPEETPVLNVTTVTHRSNPVIPAIVHGVPPGEKNQMDLALERLLLPVVRTFFPEIVDVHRPLTGATSNVLFVRLKKQYPQHARKVMSALLGMNSFATTKFMVAVDADVDIRDESRVWFHVAANTHPGRDTAILEGPAHHWDHASPVRGVGSKLCIDATRKLPEEGHPREWPEEAEMTRRVRELVDRRWQEYGLS